MDARIAAIAFVPLLLVPASGTAAPVMIEEPHKIVDRVLEMYPQVGIKNETVPDILGDNFCGGFIAIDGIGEVTLPDKDTVTMTLRTQVGYNDKEFYTNDPGRFIAEFAPSPQVMVRHLTTFQASGDTLGDLGYFFVYISAFGQYTCWDVFTNEKN